MSALRLGRLPDGTRDIRILEPAVGRVSFARYGLRASGSYVVTGAMAVGVSKYSERLEKRTGAHSPKPPKRDDLAGIPRPVCGKILRIIGEPCARKPGHGWDCKSAEDMALRAAERRAERPVIGPTKLEREERRRANYREWQRARRAMGLK